MNKKKKTKEESQWYATLVTRLVSRLYEWNMFNLTWKRAGDKCRHLYMLSAKHLSASIKTPFIKKFHVIHTNL